MLLTVYRDSTFSIERCREIVTFRDPERAPVQCEIAGDPDIPEREEAFAVWFRNLVFFVFVRWFVRASQCDFDFDFDLKN